MGGRRPENRIVENRVMSACAAPYVTVQDRVRAPMDTLYDTAPKKGHFYRRAQKLSDVQFEQAVAEFQKKVSLGPGADDSQAGTGRSVIGRVQLPPRYVQLTARKGAHVRAHDLPLPKPETVVLANQNNFSMIGHGVFSI